MSQATPGLRARKRAATHQRIADEAARLAHEKGVAGTTVEDIAAAAEVGRATFFRYFDAKEVAVAEGFSVPWLTFILDAIADAPAHLPPLDAVVDAVTGFAPVLQGSGRDLVLRQARLAQSSPGMQAWTLHVYVRFEKAIAEAVTPRFADLLPDDPRPRMVGALAMSAVRVSLDEWLASDGEKDLAALIRSALCTVAVT